MDFPPSSIRGVHLSCNLDSLKDGFENRPHLGISFADSLCGMMSSPTCREPSGRAGIVEVAIYGKGLDYRRKSDEKYIDSISLDVDRNAVDALREQGYAWVKNYNGIGDAYDGEIHVIDANAIEIIRTIPLDSVDTGREISTLTCALDQQKKDNTIRDNLRWLRIHGTEANPISELEKARHWEEIEKRIDAKTR